MHRYYGTFLIYLVEESLHQAAAPLSIREIAGGIAQLDSGREQYNLQERVRRALEILEDDGQVLKEMHPVSTHIHCYKYYLTPKSIQTDERQRLLKGNGRPAQSDEGGAEHGQAHDAGAHGKDQGLQ